jgi:hypothetical protein
MRIIYSDSLFSRARLINVLKPRLKFKGVRIRCPRCGEVGVLRMRRREGGNVLFYVYHGKGVVHSITRLVKSSLRKSWLEEILEETT